MRRFDHKIAYLLILLVFLGTGSVLASKYVIKTKNNATQSKNQTVADIAPAVTDPVMPAVSDTIKEQIVSDPPKHAAKQTVTTKSSNGGKVTTISNANMGAGDLSQYLSNCKVSATPAGVGFTDKTGRYPTLGLTLDEYLDKLRWGGEISSLCGIFVEDAGKTGWSGQYVASYQQDGNGRIVSATGAIILNSSYYSQLDRNTFNEYMKLVLSHEYGHHYTQYYKWVDLNLPVGVRFPDSYYTARPLSKASTTTDCSASWDTCDSEIIAEDYSYFYSGYGIQQMNSANPPLPLPSAATKTWLDDLTISQTPSLPTEQPAQNQNTNSLNSNDNSNSSSNSNINNNSNSTTNTNVNTNSGDTIKPVVSIIDPTLNPYSWDASVQNLVIKIRATDEVGVTKIKVYINDQFQGETASSGANLTWPYGNGGVGTYVLKAEAYDAAGNIGEISITINKT